MNDGIAIEEVDGCQDAIPELLFGRDADIAQHGTGQLGEEAFDAVEPEAVLGSEGELETARGLPCALQPELGVGSAQALG